MFTLIQFRGHCVRRDNVFSFKYNMTLNFPLIVCKTVKSEQALS